MMRSFIRKNTEYENSQLQLMECIQSYRKRRELLVSLTVDTINFFNEVSDLLCSDVSKCFDVKSLTDLLEKLGVNRTKDGKSENELKSKNLKIENPGLFILGQVNAGKSMFINSLLRKSVVPQTYARCTERIIRITYNEKNFVEVIDNKRNSFEKKNLKTCKIPEKYVKLDNVKKAKSEPLRFVRAGVNINFLKNGIDLIDTPGLNEGFNITDLTECLKENVLPIVIYIIEGKAGIRQTDTADLLELKNLDPNIKIIYFVTFLDTENIQEYEGIVDPIEIAKMKMDKAFRKLQHHNFIPTSYKNWTQCPYFHGASLKMVLEYSKSKTNQEVIFNFKQFCKFQMYLFTCLKGYFETKIFDYCEILLNFQMDISAKIINYDQNFMIKNKENFEQIALMKEIEGNMYEKIKHAISDSKDELVNRLITRLEQESTSIINPLKDTQYPSSIEIPENGIVDDPNIVDQCQISIMKVLIQGLENVLKKFVEEELFKNYKIAVEENVFQVFKGNVNNNSLKLGKSPYKVVLERTLNRKYKLERLSSISPDNGQSMVIEFMNVILSSIKSFISNSLIDKLKGNEVNVKNLEWKLKQAEECLNRCDHHILAEDVCKGLFEDFEMKHNAFLKSMEIETMLIQKKIVDSQKSRSDISKTKPTLLMLFLHTMDIKGRYLLENGEEKDLIGEGPASNVKRYILKEEEMAVKTLNLNIYQLLDISEEIFYSQQLSHINLLPITGIVISNQSEIRIFRPLKEMDLGKYMTFNVINLKSMLNISLQIAVVLKYLHDQEVIHKDLKLSNVLVDENEKIYLSDYGYCKSEVIAKTYEIGLQIHIAPEICQDSVFTKKSDMYAFGIILWYLFEGKGGNPRDSICVRPFSQVIWDRNQFESTIQMKPEKLKKFPDTIWEIMNSCWDLNPFDRPDIDDVIFKLQNYSFS